MRYITLFCHKFKCHVSLVIIVIFKSNGSDSNHCQWNSANTCRTRAGFQFDFYLEAKIGNKAV
jgi:hypothetical protein